MLLLITFNIVTIVPNNNVSETFLKEEDVRQILFCLRILKFVLKNKKQFFIETNENNVQGEEAICSFILPSPQPLSLFPSLDGLTLFHRCIEL